MAENERHREQVLARGAADSCALQVLDDEYLALLLQSGELWSEVQNTAEFQRVLKRG